MTQLLEYLNLVKLFTYLRHQNINRHRQQINAQGEGVQLQSKLVKWNIDETFPASCFLFSPINGFIPNDRKCWNYLKEAESDWAKDMIKEKTKSLENCYSQTCPKSHQRPIGVVPSSSMRNSVRTSVTRFG